MKTTIEMAREAAGDDWGLFQAFMPEIHRLAEFVRAEAIAEEREAMVALAAKQGWAMKNKNPFEDAVREIADMRARGNT